MRQRKASGVHLKLQCWKPWRRLQAASAAGEAIDTPVRPDLAAWFAYNLSAFTLIQLLPAAPAVDYDVAPRHVSSFAQSLLECINIDLGRRNDAQEPELHGWLCRLRQGRTCRKATGECRNDERPAVHH